MGRINGVFGAEDRNFIVVDEGQLVVPSEMVLVGDPDRCVRLLWVTGVGPDYREILCEWRADLEDVTTSHRWVLIVHDKGQPRLNLYWQIYRRFRLGQHILVKDKSWVTFAEKKEILSPLQDKQQQQVAMLFGVYAAANAYVDRTFASKADEVAFRTQYALDILGLPSTDSLSPSSSFSPCIISTRYFLRPGIWISQLARLVRGLAFPGYRRSTSLEMVTLGASGKHDNVVNYTYCLLIPFVLVA